MIQSGLIFSGTKQADNIVLKEKIKKQEYPRNPWKTKHNSEVGAKPTRY